MTFCPFCGAPLESLGIVDSNPCHFNYDEESPQDFTGEQFICTNLECEEYFYIDLEDPEELKTGLIIGG